MSDDPDFCLAMLQNQVRLLRAGSLPRRRAKGKADHGAKAEARAFARLQGRRGKFGIPLLPVYRFVLKNARAGIRNRENQRLARTRAFAIVRRMFRSIGAQFAACGRLQAAADIFYLELDEVQQASLDEEMELRTRVAERKTRYESWRRQPPLPDRFETNGPTGPDGEPSLVGEFGAPGAVPEGALNGLGAFPGVVEKPAAVLMTPDPTVRLDGEILVTRQTDPGWVLLFHGISGLVVERGSMLSHSAIVAREMQIPTVVGVTGAATRIATGDRLRLDGGAGTVEILEPAGGGQA
jgi:pyruvate,water dikinase